MEIIPLGDSALLVRVPGDFEHDPAGALAAVTELHRRLQHLPGVIECAPGYASLGVYFDLAQVAKASDGAGDLISWMKQRIAAAPSSPNESKQGRGSVLEIPVCYDLGFGFDLEDVGRHADLSADEIVRRHSGADYLVHCLGFAPGFPYLGGLPNELTTPRRASPRRQVPAGSVAIGGRQTGIYPAASPGGWNVVGRTPLVLFDPARTPPALLESGMRVRFRAITRPEFEAHTE